jgi:regulator of replication initiation timing
LKRRITAKGQENAQLHKKIKRMEKQLDEKDVAIGRLQTQIDENNEENMTMNAIYDSTMSQLNTSVENDIIPIPNDEVAQQHQC